MKFKIKQTRIQVIKNYLKAKRDRKVEKRREKGVN